MSERVILPRLEWHILTLEALGNARSIVQNEQLAMLRELLSARPLLEAVREFIEKFEQREQAYPNDLFPEILFSEYNTALKAAGLSLDRVSASNFRWMLGSIAKDLRRIRELVGKT